MSVAAVGLQAVPSLASLFSGHRGRWWARLSRALSLWLSSSRCFSQQSWAQYLFLRIVPACVRVRHRVRPPRVLGRDSLERATRSLCSDFRSCSCVLWASATCAVSVSCVARNRRWRCCYRCPSGGVPPQEAALTPKPFHRAGSRSAPSICAPSDA
jgi:hypothetical protein